MGRELGDSELIFDVTVSSLDLVGRHRRRSRSPGESVDMSNHVIRGQIQNALFGAAKIDRRLGAAGQAQHTAISEPESSRHRANIGSAVFVCSGNQDNWGAPVEYSWGNDGVRHCGWRCHEKKSNDAGNYGNDDLRVNIE